MTTVTTLHAAAGDLRPTLRGTLILPDDPSYDAARAVWNGMHDRRPAGIVLARGVSDVVAAVRAARDLGLPIAVRGGGHSVAGHGTADEALVVDLSPMQGVRVDPDRRLVRVEPGVTLAMLDRETQVFGLAVPIGVVSATGVGGLTLGGGVGWLTRAHGLSIDNLVAADLVTADGRFVQADDEREPELMWGLRGGGGNFGIVTSFEFRAHPLGPQVPAGSFIYHRPNWERALRAFDRWSSDIPDELTPIVTFVTPLPAWELGDEIVMVIGLVLAAGTPEDLERLIAPLRDAAAPDIEVVEPTSWLAWQAQADDLFPRGVRAYWKNAALDELDDGALDVILQAGATLPSNRTGFDIHLMGGAVARVPADATAFPNRDARFWLNGYATWEDPADDERARDWARRSFAALAPSAGRGEYVNFLGRAADDPAAAEAARRAYGDDKLARLRALKRRWDPDNVFRFNHNIEPAD